MCGGESDRELSDEAVCCSWELSRLVVRELSDGELSRKEWNSSVESSDEVSCCVVVAVVFTGRREETSKFCTDPSEPMGYSTDEELTRDELVAHQLSSVDLFLFVDCC